MIARAGAELRQSVDPAATAPADAAPLTLASFALAAAGALAPDTSARDEAPELRYLQTHRALAGSAADPWHTHLAEYLEQPHACDAALLALARDAGMTVSEVLAVTLAVTVEHDLMAGRALAWLQAPLGGSRPMLGFVSNVLREAPAGAATLDALAGGAALRTGVLVLQGEGPLAERSLAVPTPLALALRGSECDWPGATTTPDGMPSLELPPSIAEQAARHARALSSPPRRALALRSGSSAEARAVACLVAGCLGRRAAFIETDWPVGLGPWLAVRGLVPVLCVELAPGEHRRLSELPGYHGPVLAVTGLDGTLDLNGAAVASWRIPVPGSAERSALWQQALGDQRLARELAGHRHSSGRIAELARAACHVAALDARGSVARADVVAAARSAEAPGLGAFAQPVSDPVQDDALVVPASLRDELTALAARCRCRESLADALGPAARTRYHPGVRALFVGPSGTGKTLAASWLATRLAVPLYRVDLAAVTSKYIGETEKHLAQLIARAEQAEIALLFDEADALFGKRTEVKDANDRYANAQTNYLLQRIETFDGIAILTANGRGRFDSAFSRRLDAIIEFPLPAPAERRALWLAHLGTAHGLTVGELNQLAASVDCAGGHIRNAVLVAAARAQHAGRGLTYADLCHGVATEYRKLGRQVPTGLDGHRHCGDNAA